jgi:5-dehydro-2-deoxygluconokinase
LSPVYWPCSIRCSAVSLAVRLCKTRYSGFHQKMSEDLQFRDGPFLVIGRAGMDFYADPPGARVESAHQFTASLGGSAANIAVALVRLGLEASLMTAVSDDAVGRFCLNELDRYGVGRAHVARVGGEVRNSLAVVETTLVDHQSVIYRNNAADFQMTQAQVSAVDYQAFTAVIVAGTALAAEPSRAATLRALELAKAAGCPRVLDIDYRPYSWPSAEVAAEVYARAATLCDVVVGNDVEFGVMAGDHAAGLDAARKLVSLGASIVVYKRGEKGAISLTRNDEVRSAVFETQALKPTGAGDAFMGGFVAGLADGKGLRGAVEQGSAAAALVVARVGCAPAMPTREEIAFFAAAQKRSIFA